MKIEACDRKEKDFIVDRLVEYNHSQMRDARKDQVIDLSRKAVENGKIIGGIIAQMYCWDIVQVDILWVDAEHRGKDLGSRLLKEVEETAKGHGAGVVLLDTFDFQARGFYEKLGYTVFGEVNDCPKGHKRFYLQKRL